MIGLVGNQVVSTDLEQVLGTCKEVDSKFYELHQWLER
jgi:hypothetical protein